MRILPLTILGLYAGFLALLIGSSFFRVTLQDFAGVLGNVDIRAAAWLTAWTSLTSTLLSLLVAVPTAYALSRQRFPGRALVDTLVDLPIVMPNLVVGVFLLVFFNTALGKAIQGTGLRFVFAPAGIVLAQFICVAPYAVRLIKASFDNIDPRLEAVARTLGWSASQVFLRVTLPLVRGGIVAAGVIAWALAMGLYGPLMVFAGTTRQRTEVLATSVYLELSIGEIGTALAITLILVGFTLISLFIFKRYAGDRMRSW